MTRRSSVVRSVCCEHSAMYKFVIFVLYLLVSLIQISSGQWKNRRPPMNHHDLDWKRQSHSKFQLPHNHILNRARLPIPPPTFFTLPFFTTTEAPVERVNKNDPCEPYDPPLPDFSAPGRRISEIKCIEYIWQIKVRADKALRRQECDMLRSGQQVLNVVAGHYTSRGDYPNMGAIGWKATIGKWKFLCGCSLICTKFVLTAAHCSSVSERDTTIADVVPKIVRLGNKNIADKDMPDLTSSYSDVEIIKIIVHPKYNSPKQYYDIALMELGREMQFSLDIQPACLWTNSNISLDMPAEVTGWGVTAPGSLNTSPELLAAEVDIIDSEECNSLLEGSCNRNWCGLEDHQLCAGKLSGGADACKGDSGGPLTVKVSLPVTTEGNVHHILGVTSFGVSCGLPNLPGVYTKVSSFIDWIEEIVWPIK